MSERKVLNKYYPPDFDPTRIPRLKRPKNRQFCIRIMAPFNMRCATCGEYIYKGKKFNSRQERVEDEDYLGLMIFRFYIKCPRCVSEISFKTDPQNCDYSLEGGATRNFEALRTAERLAEEELKEKEEETKNNPMKVLENRTKQSQQEMEMLETLEELREMNSRHAKVDHEDVLKRHKAYEEQLRKLQDEEDEEFIRSVFGRSTGGESIKRVHDDDYDDDSLSSAASTPKTPRLGRASDILTDGSSDVSQDSHSNSITAKVAPQPKKEAATWQKSVGGLSNKKSLLGLVKKKTPATSATKSATAEKQTKLSSDDTVATNQGIVPENIVRNEESIKKINVPKEIVNGMGPVKSPDQLNGPVKSSDQPVVVKAGVLGMLAAYSDTDSDSSNG